MARYIGPKQRLQRQVGEDLGLKTNSLKTARRLHARPGMHGTARRKLSEYGVQLKEKQKVKYMYGVLEKQLHRLYSQASKNSYSVKVGDVIKLNDKSVKIPVIAELLKDENRALPAWLEKKATIAKVQRLPEREDISEVIQEQLIVEFYSR
jgi:small subunit ribosomal protein S4